MVVSGLRDSWAERTDAEPRVFERRPDRGDADSIRPLRARAHPEDPEGGVGGEALAEERRRPVVDEVPAEVQQHQRAVLLQRFTQRLRPGRSKTVPRQLELLQGPVHLRKRERLSVKRPGWEMFRKVSGAYHLQCSPQSRGGTRTEVVPGQI